MKINKKEFIDRQDDFKYHLIMHALSCTLKGEAFRKFIDDVWNKPGEEIDVTLTVGGMELDLQQVCDDWNKQVDRMIEEEARKMVKESYGDRLDKINDMLDQVANNIKDKFGLKDKE